MFIPTPRMRKRVRSFVFLEFTPEHIAKHLGCTRAELESHFGHELRYARAEILAQALERLKELAAQRQDLRVALEASQFLQNRSQLMSLAEQVDDLEVAYEACCHLAGDPS